MTVVSKRTRTTLRHEYVMPSPANWQDVKHAMEIAADERSAAGFSNRWDDVIKVESVDDEIVVFWVESKP